MLGSISHDAVYALVGFELFWIATRLIEQAAHIASRNFMLLSASALSASMLSNPLNNLLNFAIAYLSLENCRGCGTAVDNRQPLKAPQSICTQCWLKLHQECSSSPASPPATVCTVPVLSVGLHHGLLRKLIIKLKQREDLLLGADLVHFFISSCESRFTRTHLASTRVRKPRSSISSHLSRNDLLIVPMPLHKMRLRTRGFNQSEIIAGFISSMLKLPKSTTALFRVKDTRPQRGLGRDDRQINVHGAFTARPDRVTGKTIILVDDVHTSGATMEAAAQALFEAGAKSATGLCIAAAPLHNVTARNQTQVA